jgi:hypothetical protein
VTLISVSAIHNAATGTLLNNTFGTGNVSLKGLNTFVGNRDYGLSVLSNGSVVAEHLAAHDNGSVGAEIDNTTAPTPKAVTITGSGAFNGNNSNGLNIQSDGSITTNRLTASNNGGGGIVLITNLVTTAPSVTMKGDNIVSGNANGGLWVQSASSVLLNRVIATSNSSAGIVVQSDGNATLICSSAFGNAMGLFVSNRAGNPLNLLTLSGFFASGNTTANEDIHADSVVRSPCP